MQLIWRPKAHANLQQILDYVSDRNVFAADRLNETINAAAEMLTLHPFMGWTGRVAATREWVVHPNYVLIYRVDSDRVTILAVLHAVRITPDARLPVPHAARVDMDEAVARIKADAASP